MMNLGPFMTGPNDTAECGVYVGDCRELRLIHGSVEDGCRAALAIQ